MKRVSIILASFLLTLSSCDPKDIIPDNEDPTPNNTAPSLVDLIDANDAKGVFVGILSVSEQSTPMGNVTMNIGTAVAVVGNLSNGNYNDVGKVECFVGATPKAYELTKQNNNAYVFTPSMTEPTGIPFTSGSAGIPFWEIPSLSISTGSYYNFPAKPDITSATTIDKNSGYEFTVNGYNGAHEVLYSISSNGKSVHKIIKSSDPEFVQKKVTFSASELSVLDNSEMALLQVAPYTLHDKTINGNKYYFINETVMTKTAKLQ